MLIIDLAPLSKGLHRLSYDPEPGTLELDAEEFSDVSVDVVLDLQEERALVTVQVRAQAHLICDRTLEPFQQEIEGAYTILFATRREATPGFEDKDSDEPHDEVRTLDLADLRLDITDVVRDTLVLALPQRRVAPGAEDLDLQTEYGAPTREEARQEIDPRWEALQKLRTDNTGE